MGERVLECLRSPDREGGGCRCGADLHDEAVGDRVRVLYDQCVQKLLRDILGVERAALFAAVLFGISLVEKSLLVDGIADPSSETYRVQLRHMMGAALEYQS